MEFDYIIKNGNILDGSGSPAYIGDVGIIGSKIAAVGNLGDAQAKTVIDADGKWVTPGFIDIHRHGDMAAFRDEFGELELRQGITTMINGNCGMSAAPINANNAAYMEPVIGKVEAKADTATLDGYLRSLESTVIAVNCGMLAGSGTVRSALFGYTNIEEEAEYKLLQKEIEKQLKEGAFGVSLGLGYAPECFCSTEDLIRGLEPLRNTNIPFAVHMRNEGDGMVDCVAEVISIARELKAPLHISHFKAIGKRNWHKSMPAAIKLIDEARQDGVDITFDVYPYTAGSTQLMHVLPPEFIEGGIDQTVSRLMDKDKRRRLAERLETGRDFENIVGMMGWENVLMTGFAKKENAVFEGMSIEQAAKEMGVSPVDCLCQLLARENCAITMIDYITCEEDIAAALRHPCASVISDALYPIGGNPHPRLYGTFSRVIERYVLQLGVLTPEQAVCRMSGAPAKAMGIAGKELIKEGLDADINVFDPRNIHEAATYGEPRKCSLGMDWVFVNGVPALQDGRLEKGRFGRVLRR